MGIIINTRVIKIFECTSLTGQLEKEIMKGIDANNLFQKKERDCNSYNELIEAFENYYLKEKFNE